MLARFWSGEFSAGGGPLTRLLSQRIGALFAFSALRLSLSPNVVTVLGLCLSMLASMVYVSDVTLAVSLWSLLLYQLAYALDCADGQLARAAHSGSDFGAWLDINCDAVGVLVMAFALVFFFHTQAALNLYSLLAVTLVTSGRIVHLYSVPAVKAKGPGSPMLVPGPRKSLLWLLLDTPFFYLCVCGLHGYSNALMAYLALMGGIYGLAALNNVRRLPGAPLSAKISRESPH